MELDQLRYFLRVCGVSALVTSRSAAELCRRVVREDRAATRGVA